MKKTFRKPENWQDFESLCKKLWGEIWNCSEIKKNGRSGQLQHGVDIYGMPKRETQYFGIQCKGKDDYTNSALTKKEVDEEVEKAKSFSPPLKKLYFATSANKDSTIEEYVRQKDVANREADGFEIHLFCWEDIADLIDENKGTFDWYVKNINHRIAFDVSVTFQDDSQSIAFHPKIYRNHISYRLKPFEKMENPLHYIDPRDRMESIIKIATEPQPFRYFINGVTTNQSASVFSIRITNTGNTAIKNYKLYLEFIGDNFVVAIARKQNRFLDNTNYDYDTYIWSDPPGGLFKPESQILVQTDSIRSDDICIRPISGEQQHIEINWRLVSEDFDDSGALTLKLTPQIVEKKTVEDYEYPKPDEIRFDNYT